MKDVHLSILAILALVAVKKTSNKWFDKRFMILQARESTFLLLRSLISLMPARLLNAKSCARVKTMEALCFAMF